jgi:molecular chaperone DnaK (HSP70)
MHSACSHYTFPVKTSEGATENPDVLELTSRMVTFLRTTAEDALDTSVAHCVITHPAHAWVPEWGFVTMRGLDCVGQGLWGL